MTHRVYISLAVVAATCVIVIASLAPKGTLPPYIAGCSTLLHTVAFGMMTFVAALLCRNDRQLIKAVLAVLAIGLAMELLQHFIPGRTADGRDLMANAIGVAVGGLMAYASAHVHADRAANDRIEERQKR